MHIAETTIDTILARQDDLLREHWGELAPFKHLNVLKPDAERYRALEAAGVLFCIGVFDGDDLVGYSVNLVAPNLHYRDTLVSQNDVLYLAPKHRGGSLGLGRALIATTETKAKSLGAHVQLWHAKGDTALEALLRRAQYPVVDIVFGKEL